MTPTSAQNRHEPANLGSIARGALLELFERSAIAVAKNIADTSTEAGQTREIVLKLKIKPDPDRVGLTVTSTASTKMASVAAHVSRAYVNKDKAGAAYIFDEDPRQAELFEPPAAPENLREFKAGSA